MIVVASVLHSYATYARLSLTRPSPSDYDGAAAYVRARWQPGDLIDANPFWATRSREHLGDLSFQGFRDLEAEDLKRYRRVWLFSLFGAEDRISVRRAMERAGLLAEERQFGRIDVRLYSIRDPEPVRFDFREALDQAHVWTQRDDERRDCTAAEGGRWRCSPAEWNYVGREILEVAGEPRAVIWAHPVSGADLVIEFEHVPFSRALTIGAGFTREAVDYGGPPVELRVEADGRALMRRLYRPRPSFSRERIETPDLTGLHRVRFSVTATDDRVRHFCFTADTRD